MMNFVILVVFLAVLSFCAEPFVRKMLFWSRDAIHRLIERDAGTFLVGERQVIDEMAADFLRSTGGFRIRTSAIEHFIDPVSKETERKLEKILKSL